MAGDKVVTLSDAEFDTSVLKAGKPALVDFWAEWCQPCKMLAPTVEELAGCSRTGRWCNRWWE